MTTLIQKAKDYVYNQTKNKLTPEKGFYFHNWNHFIDVYNRAKYLSEKLGIHEEEIENILLAAIFHDIGYIKQYKNNEPIGAQIAEQWLKKENLSTQRIEKIKNLIIATMPFYEPKNIHEMIIKDADLDNLGREDFLDKTYDIKKELEYNFKIKLDEIQFLKDVYNFINSVKFYTPIQIQERQKQFEINKQILLEKIKNTDIFHFSI